MAEEINAGVKSLLQTSHLCVVLGLMELFPSFLGAFHTMVNPAHMTSQCSINYIFNHRYRTMKMPTFAL